METKRERERDIFFLLKYVTENKTNKILIVLKMVYNFIQVKFEERMRKMYNEVKVLRHIYFIHRFLHSLSHLYLQR